MKVIKSIRLTYSPELRREIEERCPGDWNLENFRRASLQAKLAMLGAVAVLYSEKIPLDEVVVAGIGGAGCVEDNLAYWNDYLENGRTMARGSLFVATLPSTPAAEAAIAVGAHGGVLYCSPGALPETKHPVLLLETTREEVLAQLLLPDPEAAT